MQANPCDPDLILIAIRSLDPDHLQNLIDCSFVRDTPLLNISCKSADYVLSIPTDKQTDGQMNRQTDTNKNITNQALIRTLI